MQSFRILRDVVNVVALVFERIKIPVTVSCVGSTGPLLPRFTAKQMNTSSVNPCTNVVVPCRFDSPLNTAVLKPQANITVQVITLTFRHRASSI